MNFGQRSINKTRGTLSRTPTKSPIRKDNYKQQPKLPTHYQKTTNKTKQSMGIMYLLEDIYGQLSFNEYDTFPKQKIQQARKTIEKLYKYLKEQPVCPKHPQHPLSLYCQKQKQLVCVNCAHGKFSDHRGHPVKTLETVQKTIEYEIIRSHDKSKQLVNQLNGIHEEMDELAREMSEIYMSINNNSISIINQTIKQLQAIKEEYDNKLNLAYRRTDTIIRRYNQSLDDMLHIMENNLKKASTMNGLSKYLLLKEINKESVLMEEFINKFNENRILMDQWRRSQRESEKAVAKKKIVKQNRDDIIIVTEI